MSLSASLAAHWSESLTIEQSDFISYQCLTSPPGRLRWKHGLERVPEAAIRAGLPPGQCGRERQALIRIPAGRRAGTGSGAGAWQALRGRG